MNGVPGLAGQALGRWMVSVGLGQDQPAGAVFPLVLPGHCHSSVSPAHPQLPAPSSLPQQLEEAAGPPGTSRCLRG